MVIIFVLTVTLVGVIRWSMNVTEANARQISRNLTRMRDHLQEGQTADERSTGETAGGVAPSIDPVDSGRH
jgi:hypothetical protein